MGKIILITGGARSGKSTYAEKLAKEMAPTESDTILYLATCLAEDAEMHDRVKKHQDRRPKQWQTLEAPEQVGERILEQINSQAADKENELSLQGILLDCITLLVSQCMVKAISNWDVISVSETVAVEEAVQTEIQSLLNASMLSPVPIILVTNETGMGLVPEYPAGRLFRDMAGRANQMLAAVAEEVYLCVSGIPVKIK